MPASLDPLATPATMNHVRKVIISYIKNPSKQDVTPHKKAVFSPNRVSEGFKYGERTKRLVEQNLSVHKDPLAQKNLQKSHPVDRCIFQFREPGPYNSQIILRRTAPAETQSRILNQVVYIEQFFGAQQQKNPKVSHHQRPQVQQDDRKNPSHTAREIQGGALLPRWQ